MLMPFDWAVLTVEDARLLRGFIQKVTGTPAQPKNYKKMQDAGVLDIYHKLDEFVEARDHYQNDLRRLDPNDFEPRSYDHY
jgi:hypothetical protein